MKIIDTKFTLFTDPVIETTRNGNLIAKVTLVEHHFKKEGNDFKLTGSSFYNDATFFGDAAEIISTYVKDDKIMVLSGNFKKPSFKGRDGKYRNSEDLIVYEFETYVPKTYDND